LLMFTAFLYVRLFVRGHRHAFLVVTLSLIGAHYWVAALAKLELGPEYLSWLTENHMSNILPSSYENGGWLRPLGKETIVSLAAMFRSVEILLAGASLLIEASGLLLGLHRRVAIVALCAMAMLHAGIALSSGFFFWKWMLMDLFVAAYVHETTKEERSTRLPSETRALDWIKGRSSFSLSSTAIVALSAVFAGELFAPVRFGWWDTSFMTYFEVRGRGASGQEYILDARFFSPYDMYFTNAEFPYLKQGGYMGGSFGIAFDLGFAKELEGVEPDQLPAIRDRYERRLYDAHWAEEFRRFVITYVKNAEKHGRSWWPRLLAPPYHFQTFRVENHYTGQEPLSEVEVWHLERLHTDQAIEEVGESMVMQIDLSR